jgi:hypothetical protein
MTLATRQVTATLRQPDTRIPLSGTVTFTPGGGVLVDPGTGRILAGASTLRLDRSGTLALPLVTTDSTGIQPAANTWNWNVEFNLVDSVGAPAVIEPFNFALPTGADPVDLASVIQVAALGGTYLVVPGHTPQLYGGSAVPSTVHTDGDLYLRTNGDLYQQVSGAWGSPVGNIQGPAGSGGGGGSTDATVSVRVTDDNLSGLPSASSWAVVVTSGGTPLSGKIPAVAGQRIEIYPDFMYAGSHFLDWVLLDNTGAISEYAGSVTSSPLPEGAPELYPSLSFGKCTSVVEFTVASNHIDGQGNVTLGLAHQGTGSGIVYAHTVYPWDMRLKNIGAQPS